MYIYIYIYTYIYIEICIRHIYLIYTYNIHIYILYIRLYPKYSVLYAEALFKIIQAPMLTVSPEEDLL